MGFDRFKKISNIKQVATEVDEKTIGETKNIVAIAESQVLKKEDTFLNNINVNLNTKNIKMDFNFLDDFIDNEHLNIKAEIENLAYQCIEINLKEKITTGKILNEIFELTRYSKSNNLMCFKEILDVLGINYKTAQRRRNLATLFEKVNNETNKAMIPALSQKRVVVAFKLLNEDENFFEDNVFNSLEEMNEYLDMQESELSDKKEKVLKLEKANFSTYFNHIESNWTKLDDETKDKVNTYLEKIEKLVAPKEEVIEVTEE